MKNGVSSSLKNENLDKNTEIWLNRLALHRLEFRTEMLEIFALASMPDGANRGDWQKA